MTEDVRDLIALGLMLAALLCLVGMLLWAPS